MVTAFVLINMRDKEIKDTADRLLSFGGVKEVHVVAGEYDMVAVCRVPDNQQLSELITQKIIHADGVDRTKTLFALESYATFDLDEFFGEK